MEVDSSRFFIFKQNPTDKIWHVQDPEMIGPNMITFDKKKIYNTWPDYPFNMSKEELELYNKENPYWEDFYSSRREDDVRFREETFQNERLIFEYIWEKDSSGNSDARYEGISVLSNGVILHKTYDQAMDRPKTIVVAAIEPRMADKIKAIIDDKMAAIKLLSTALGSSKSNPMCYFQFAGVKIYTGNIFLEKQKGLSIAKRNLLDIFGNIATVFNKKKCGIHFKKNGKIVRDANDFSELIFTNIHEERVFERMDSYSKFFGTLFPSWLYNDVLPGLYIIQLVNLCLEVKRDVFSLGYLVVENGSE